MTNVTSRACNIVIPLSEIGVDEKIWLNLLGDPEMTAQDGKLDVSLQPYDVIWLIPSCEKGSE